MISFLPAPSSPSPPTHLKDIHSPTLSLLGLSLQRGFPHAQQQFLSQDGLQLVYCLLQSHQTSQQLVEASLSLFHGHRISIPFQFQRVKPPSLNLPMSCLVLPVLHSSAVSQPPEPHSRAGCQPSLPPDQSGQSRAALEYCRSWWRWGTTPGSLLTCAEFFSPTFCWMTYITS